MENGLPLIGQQKIDIDQLMEELEIVPSYKLAKAFLDLHTAYAALVGKVTALEGGIMGGHTKGKMLDYIKQIRASSQLEVNHIREELLGIKEMEN